MRVNQQNGSALPASWRVQRLSEFNGYRPTTINPALNPDEDFEYYSIPAYQADRKPLVAKGSEIGSAKLLLKSGTVLFGKLNPRVEKVWRVGSHTKFRKIGSTEWLPIVPTEDVDEEFLYFLMWSEHVMPKAKTLVSGSTPSRQRVDPRSFYRIEAPLPPLSEQRKIAGVLRFVQLAIEDQERLLALTAELKKSLLHQLFTHGLGNEPQRQTDLGPVPQIWQFTTLAAVAKFQTGGTPSRTNPDYWSAGDIPWVKTTEINYKVIEQTEEFITRKGLENSAAKIFPKGTLLVAMYGQGVTRGRVGILGIDAATNQACAAITPYDEDQIASSFIYFFLEFHYQHLRQLGHGANQRNLNIALLKNFPVAFPSRDEQTEIVRILRTLDSKREIHHRRHAILSTLFSTLLHELMTARISIQDIAFGDVMSKI